jgi:hypothetical protein
MLRPSYYLILQILTQIVEIITLTGDTDDKVAMKFRMLLCIPQRFSINNIKLNVMSVETEV